MRKSILLLAATLSLPLAPAWGGTEVGTRTFYGENAGAQNTTGTNVTFIGGSAGRYNNGIYNTLVGDRAGSLNTGGNSNTFVGANAGAESSGTANTFLGASAGYYNDGVYNLILGTGAGLFATGSRNVFIGRQAGYDQQGDHKLVIDNCFHEGFCPSPLIYGEFDNRLLRLDGVFHAAAAGVSKSQLHFSLDHTDTGGYLTSVLDNNFFTSSGARWDGSAGGWIQRSPDGKAVIAGSGGAGYRILTSSGTAVDAVAAPVTRLHIDYNGLMGVNTAPAAGRAINTSTGAYLSSGGAWVNASSRELKEDIQELSRESALRTLRELKPVTFRYKSEAGETHAGFIAEDAPELVATADRKGLSALDVVAVLTKVLKEKDREIEQLQDRMRRIEAALEGAGLRGHER